MSILSEQISETLLPGMHLPNALDLLFSWIEDNHFYIDVNDKRIGILFPVDNKGIASKEVGTNIEFSAQGNKNVKYWFPREFKEASNRLSVFAQTGGEGSVTAFWLDENDQQKIVHMGSGSGSTLACVLAENAIDFLRLLAIGYAEICWDEAFESTPAIAHAKEGYTFFPNLKYQDWVKSTFSVTIPKTAAEIIKHPSRMEEPDLRDPFAKWIEPYLS